MWLVPLGEAVKFEHAHRPFQDRLAAGERRGEVRPALRTDVHALPAVGNGLGRVRLLVGVRRESVSTQRVGRQMNRNPLGLGCLEEGQASPAHIGLDKRTADLTTLGLHEGVRHATTDDQLVHAVEQVLQHSQLELTLAPPITAATGFSAPPSTCSSALTSPSIRKPNALSSGKKRAITAVDAWARCTVPKASLT